MTLRVFTFFFAFLIGFSAYSQVHVNTVTGLDAPGRGGSGNPYKTIRYAVTQAGSGVVVQIAPGTYYESGTIEISKPLTLSGSNDGSTIIDANFNLRTIIHIDNTGDVTIERLTLRNSIGKEARGIHAEGAGANITIQNCNFNNIGWVNHISLNLATTDQSMTANAIIAAGNKTTPLSNVRLLNNVVSECATGWGEAVTITGNVDGFRIEGNTISKIGNIGIVAAGNYTYTEIPADRNQARNGIIRNNEVSQCMSPNGLSAGIYLDGALNCIVERNKVYRNGVGLSIGGEQPLLAGAPVVSGHRIYNNLCYNNVTAGIVIGVHNGLHSLRDTYVFNNTFFNNCSGELVNGVTGVNGVNLAESNLIYMGEVHMQNTNGVFFVNNVVHARNNRRVLVALTGYGTTNFSSDYNLYYGDFGNDGSAVFDVTSIPFNNLTGGNYYRGNLPAFQSLTALEAHSGFGDALFVSKPGYNLQLTALSPAIDMGDPAYVQDYSGTIDFAGTARVYGGRIDAGAYEFNSNPLEVVYRDPLRATLENSAVLLQWATVMEKDAGDFEIERSADGRRFITVGTVQSAENSEKVRHYSWIDPQALPGISYYRLKAMNADGSFNLSRIVSVAFNTSKSTGVQIYPNPVSDVFYIRKPTGKSEVAEAQIISLSGSVLMNEKSDMLSVLHLPSGIYFVKVRFTSGETEVHRLSVTR